MPNPTKMIHDLTSGEISEVEMTDEETVDLLNGQKQLAEELKIEASKALARTALLERLGISEEEAQLLK